MDEVGTFCSYFSQFLFTVGSLASAERSALPLLGAKIRQRGNSEGKIHLGQCRVNELSGPVGQSLLFEFESCLELSRVIGIPRLISKG